MKKVMLFGTFDGLHKGHRDLFRQAQEYGDYHVVVVARDVTVRRVKGQLPQFSEEKRLMEVERVDGIDEVRLGVTEGDRYQVIRDYMPDVIVLGYDQDHFLDGLFMMIKDEDLGIEIVRAAPYKPDVYKSSLLKNLQKEEMVVP